MFKKAIELYQYRELIKNLTLRDIKLKYKGSILGYLWSLINPLMMMVVYYFVFVKVFKTEGIPNFPVYILVGILPWMFFQGSLMVSTQSISSNAGLIKKIYFPREIFPLTNIFSNFYTYVTAMPIILLALIIFKIKFTPYLLLLPVVLFFFILMTTGFCLALSALNVIYRDVQHFVEIIFMAWMYMTPIVYSIYTVPENLRPFLYLNPLTSVINCIRNSTMNGMYGTFNWGEFAIVVVSSLVILYIGQTIFSKIHKRFAEEI